MRFTGTTPMEQVRIFRGENLFNLREDINEWLKLDEPELTREPLIAVTETTGDIGARQLSTTIVYHYKEKQPRQTGIGDVLQPVQD